jgi:hypothetical protein
LNARAAAPAALALLLAPAITALAVVILPGLAVSEGAADALAFAGGASVGLVSLALASPWILSPRVALGLGGGGAALLGVVALASPRTLPPGVAVAVVNLALVCIGHAVGSSIGRRVAHHGHLLPACAVAAAADLASVLHPSGPSHAIAGSERALSLLAVGFPVPGEHAVVPALGLGDLVFLALVFGVAGAHRLSRPRVLVVAAVGLALAGGMSAVFQAAIPALVPVGAAVVVGVPEARRVRPEDRRTTVFAIAASAAVVLGVLLSPH